MARAEDIPELTRSERCAVAALVEAVEHEDALRPVVVSDYALARKRELHQRQLRGVLERRLNALAGHVDEPGSRSNVPMRDGLVPYGTEDPTGFAPGCVV